MSIDWKDYLTSQGAVFSSNGSIRGFSSTPDTDTEKPRIALLESQAFIEVSGSDSQRFLQGQLSCNLEKLLPNQHTTGVACNAKGRMYASFRILNTGHSYLLRMHQGLTKTFIDNLSRYSVFYKSELKTPEPALICLGLHGDNIASSLGHFCPLPPSNDAIGTDQNSLLLKETHINNAYELWLPVNSLPYWWEKLRERFNPDTENNWIEMRIKSGSPQVLPEYVEKYTPQHLNFPSLGSVSFRKGCYTGQEIIARMQNLGQQKSRTYPIAIKNVEGALPISAKLENGHGKPVGEILEATEIDDKGSCQALAVIKIESAESSDVLLPGKPDSTIEVQALPYPIDARKELQN